MTQLELAEFGLPDEIRHVLGTLRATQHTLWFPHENQRAFITWAPEPSPAGTEDATDAADAPWVKTLTRTATAMRLTTRQVVDRLRADSAEFDTALVRPVRCSTCRDPVPDTELVASASVAESFCSACCMHEVEHELTEPPTPTHSADVYTHPLLHAHWTRQNADRADAHLPRWSDA